MAGSCGCGPRGQRGGSGPAACCGDEWLGVGFASRWAGWSPPGGKRGDRGGSAFVQLPAELVMVRTLITRARGVAVRPGRRLDRDRPPGRQGGGGAMSAADRAIRVSTAAAVVSVASIAAYVSYWHAFEVVRAHGETGITARLEPATIDALEAIGQVLGA